MCKILLKPLTLVDFVEAAHQACSVPLAPSNSASRAEQQTIASSSHNVNKCINKQVHHTLCIQASPSYCISVHLNHCISPLPAFNLRRLPESTSIIVDQICLHCSNNRRMPVTNCQLPTQLLLNVTKTGSFLVQLLEMFCNRLRDTV